MTAPAPTDDRLCVVVDRRSGETVFGPETRAEVGDWIIREGWWMGADLRVDVIEPACTCGEMTEREAAALDRWEAARETR